MICTIHSKKNWHVVGRSSLIFYFTLFDTNVSAEFLIFIYFEWNYYFTWILMGDCHIFLYENGVYYF